MTKYIITRTSENPIKGSKLEDVECWEIINCTKDKLTDNDGFEDFKYGNTICCRRRYTKSKFVIDIDNLEEFSDKIGEDIILFAKSEEYPYRVIEIYDRYRE